MQRCRGRREQWNCVVWHTAIWHGAFGGALINGAFDGRFAMMMSPHFAVWLAAPGCPVITAAPPSLLTPDRGDDSEDVSIVPPPDIFHRTGWTHILIYRWG